MRAESPPARFPDEAFKSSPRLATLYGGALPTSSKAKERPAALPAAEIVSQICAIEGITDSAYVLLSLECGLCSASA